MADETNGGGVGERYERALRATLNAHQRNLLDETLAARVSAAATRARAEERERIAQAIEVHLDDLRGRDTWTLRDAARIARGDA